MHSCSLTISGSQLDGLTEEISNSLSEKDRSIHDLGEVTVLVVESGYRSRIGAGTLSSTIIVDQRQAEQTAVSLVTAGGGGGMLHLRAGEAEKQTSKLVSALKEICTTHGWDLQTEDC